MSKEIGIKKSGGNANNSAPCYCSGGGGGAGTVGTNGTATVAGAGGNGLTWYGNVYGGGGGGGASLDGGPIPPGSGGSGGGGAGGNISSSPNGVAGTANTGGGGGGGGAIDATHFGDGGAGGSGIVIVRYPLSGSSIVTNTPTYDADGNLTNNNFAYTWDCENRLIGASNTNTVASYAYDCMSRRSRKVVNGTTTNTFVYDGWNLISEICNTESQIVTNFYVWGLDLSGTMQGAGGIGGLLSVTRSTSSGASTYYPCYDANGNISDYVDTNGTVVAHREYDAFGNTIVASGSMVDDFNFWFSTKYLDQETGLYYYGYRYYSPGMGRWLSRDPLGEAGEMGLYVFAHNAPTVFLDLFGLKTYSCTVHYTRGPIVAIVPDHRYMTVGGASYGLYPGGVKNYDGPNKWPAPTYWIWCSEVKPPKCLTEAEFDTKMLEAIGESDTGYRMPTHMCIQWVSEVLSAGNKKADEEVKKKKADCLNKSWKWRKAEDPKDCCYCAEK